MNVAYMTLQISPVKHEIADAAGNPLISFEWRVMRQKKHEIHDKCGINRLNRDIN